MHPGYRMGKVYLCQLPVDFRKSISGLSVMVEQDLSLHPFELTVYVFTNRRYDKLKVLSWHRNGFCLWQKRLEAEKFPWVKSNLNGVQQITLQQFEWLLESTDIWRIKPHKTLDFHSVS